jgi:hypothetical protein
VTTCEEENTRVAKMLAETRAELEELKSRRWWHLFLPVVKFFKQWTKAATA